MEVRGSLATGFVAVRLDNFATVNEGPLISADDQTGEVVWTDKVGEQRNVMLGAHMVKIVPRGHGR
jgi:hypothetical protein